MSNIITLTQKPIIDFSKLSEVGQEIQNEIAKYNIDNIIATEETLKDINALITKFNKESEEYEASRIAIKEAVNEPYDKFNEAYKKHIKSQYETADTKLKASRDNVVEKIIKEKQKRLEDYFMEVNDIDFITFEKVGLNIVRSTADSKLKKQIDEFVLKIKNDLELIKLEEYKERILVRYKQTLDVSRAIISVKQEIEQEQALIQRKEQERIAQERVKEVIEPEVVKEPQKEVIEQVENPKVLSMQFTVHGTIEQLKSVKNFLDSEGLKYE